MDFVKKHYEKILLALVLVGLTGAVIFLLLIVPQEQKKLQDLRTSLINPSVKALPELNSRAEDVALERLQASAKPDFTTGHNLLNPVQWQIAPGGGMRKIDSANKIGPEALKLVATKPLYLIVSYNGTNASGFYVKIEQQTNPQKPTTITPVRVEGPGPVINLKHFTGTIENPVELQLEFKNTHETFTITPDKPFQRVDGYMADLKYAPDPTQIWSNMRPYNGPSLAADPRPLILDGVRYSVVDVKENSVTVSSQSNSKHTTITNSP